MVPGSQAGEAAPPAALGLRTLDAAGSAEVRPAAPRRPPMGSAPAPGAVTRKWPLVPRKWPLVARGAQVGVLAGPVRCCRRARASRREPSWTLPAEPAGDPAPPGSGRAQRGCGPRLPRRFPGAVLFFGPSWKQRPSRAPVPPADRAPLAVSDAGAVGVSRCESSLPARACCSRVPKARVESWSCCADGRSGTFPSVRAAVPEQRGSVSSWSGPAFPSVCVLMAQPPCSRPPRLLTGRNKSENARLFPGLGGQFPVNWHLV